MIKDLRAARSLLSTTAAAAAPTHRGHPVAPLAHSHKVDAGNGGAVEADATQLRARVRPVGEKQHKPEAVSCKVETQRNTATT